MLLASRLPYQLLPDGNNLPRQDKVTYWLLQLVRYFKKHLRCLHSLVLVSSFIWFIIIVCICQRCNSTAHRNPVGLVSQPSRMFFGCSKNSGRNSGIGQYNVTSRSVMSKLSNATVCNSFL